jgi:ankyrin repeat protein
MHAARIGAVSLRKWLQAAGADSKLRDRTGRTAGDWARTAEKRHLGASSGDLDDSRLNRSEFSREDIFSAIAGHRDEDVARRLPASPQALNSRRGGMDPVHLAAALGHESTLRLLLDHGASLGAATDDSLTVLTVAAQFHQMDLISAFSEKLSAPARKEQIGQLHSVWKQHREIDALKAMLLLGWEPAEPNDAQFAAQDAVRENDLPLLKRLLALSVVLTPAPERPDDPFQPDRAHENFLKLAAAHDDLAVLDYLLARLAVKEPQWHENVTAALHSASSAGRVPAMRLLVEKAGADVNAGLRSHHGVSNHVYAPKDKNVRITAISLALERGERESVDFLLARGARMQGCDSYSRPPLAAAVVSRDIGLVKLALEHRAELDAVSNEGRTALHEAAERGLVEIARLLMQRGINPSLRDKDKLTAAELARQEGQPAW